MSRPVAYFLAFTHAERDESMFRMVTAVVVTE